MPSVRVVIGPTICSMVVTGNSESLMPRAGSQNHSRPRNATRSASGTRARTAAIEFASGALCMKVTWIRPSVPAMSAALKGSASTRARSSLRFRRNTGAANPYASASAASILSDLAAAASSLRNAMLPAAWYAETSVKPSSMKGSINRSLVSRRPPVLIARRKAK